MYHTRRREESAVCHNSLRHQQRIFLEMVWDKKVGDVLQLSVVRASQNDLIHVNWWLMKLLLKNLIALIAGHGTSEADEVRAAAVLFMLTFVEYYLSSPNSGWGSKQKSLKCILTLTLEIHIYFALEFPFEVSSITNVNLTYTEIRFSCSQSN
ncbi:hypothetical protein OROGR_032995 [Orobanche gracilis]